MKDLYFILEENYSELHSELYNKVLEYYMMWYGGRREMFSFKTEDYGKPYILLCGQKTNLEFNISHSNGVGVVIFSAKKIGIDIEKIDSYDENIVKRFFCNDEKEYIYGAVNEELRRQYFYEVWTKKEAYAKWSGRGISEKLLHCNVTNLKYEFNIWYINGIKYAMSVYS